MACWWPPRASCLAAAHADPVTSYYFFGDSLTDEGRNGRTAPVIWAEVLRNDLSITSGQNFAIGGATSGNQASATFGNSGFLGQVNSFVSGAPYANAAAGVWIGTDDVQLGAAHIPAASIAATATQNVRTGLAAIVGAGVGTVSLLGVYDLSLTNAYELAGAGTPAVRGNAAQASQLYNAQLASLTVPGVTIRYYDIANFINQLQVNARAYGFTQILPLQPGQTCNATCQQTSIFADTIHLTSRTQTLIGNYVASGNPIYNSAGFTYGAIETNIASAAATAGIGQRLAGAAADRFNGSLLDRIDATRGLAPVAAGGDGRPNPWTIYAYGGGAGGGLAHVGTPASFQGDLDATLTASPRAPNIARARRSASAPLSIMPIPTPTSRARSARAPASTVFKARSTPRRPTRACSSTASWPADRLRSTRRATAPSAACTPRPPPGCSRRRAGSATSCRSAR